jgi:uncharacterized protein YrrD
MSCKIGASDGEIGHVVDFYFDDDAWVIRYLVAQTGPWLLGRKVLISPRAVNLPKLSDHVLPVSLTLEQIRHSPDIDTQKPVSRQDEMRYLEYYGYTFYWERAEAQARARSQINSTDDPHLRSCRAITGYKVHATDGDLGQIQDVIVDDALWAVRYVIVDTSEWWSGHLILVAVDWIEEISWAEQRVHIELTREILKGSPVYQAGEVLNRSKEIELYKHVSRDGYWLEKLETEAEIAD